MSRRNRIGKELAKERAAIAKAEEEYRAKRNKRLAIYGPILGVVVIAAVVSLVLAHPFSSKSTPTAKTSTTTSSSAIASSSASASASSSASAPSGASSSASASASSSPSASKS